MRRLVLGLLLLFALGDSCSPNAGVVGVQDYGQVTGRILDAMTNRPIPSALVSVGSLYAASSDARGAFVLGRVPAGDQTVTARAAGYSSGSGDVTIPKDKTVSVGFIRLVPLIHPEGQPTLAPPATPTPEPVPTGAPSIAPAPGLGPTFPPLGSPTPSATLFPAQTPSPQTTASPTPLPSATPAS